MPRGDGTGPVGIGPMTGRAAGYCAGYPTPRYGNPVGGRGFWGGGRGGGRGYRHWFWATGLPRWARAGYGALNPNRAPPAPNAPAVDPAGEVEGLRRQAESLEGALGEIRGRIEQLEANRKDSPEPQVRTEAPGGRIKRSAAMVFWPCGGGHRHVRSASACSEAQPLKTIAGPRTYLGNRL